MTGGPLKLAKSLQPGDCIVTTGREHLPQEMTVLAVLEATQVSERRVCLVTLRLPDGGQIERRFYPNTAVRLADSP